MQNTQVQFINKFRHNTINRNLLQKQQKQQQKQQQINENKLNIFIEKCCEQEKALMSL